MIKVYLKIPGVDRPYAVSGKKVYEDEKYIEILSDVVRKKIPHGNILYTEEIAVVTPEPPQPMERPPETPAFPQLSYGPRHNIPAATDNEFVDITVSFVGHASNTFSVKDVPRSAIDGGKWNVPLSMAVFSNPQVKAFTGNFLVSECEVDGRNVVITTTPAAPESKVEDLQKRVEGAAEVLTKLQNLEAKKTFERPSMRLPQDFSISGSPFEVPANIDGE